MLKIMQFKIFLEDMNEETIERIKWVLRHDLTDEINAAATQSGINWPTAENEIIDAYLNQHNFGWNVEL